MADAFMPDAFSGCGQNSLKRSNEIQVGGLDVGDPAGCLCCNGADTSCDRCTRFRQSGFGVSAPQQLREFAWNQRPGAAAVRWHARAGYGDAAGHLADLPRGHRRAQRAPGDGGDLHHACRIQGPGRLPDRPPGAARTPSMPARCSACSTGARTALGCRNSRSASNSKPACDRAKFEMDVEPDAQIQPCLRIAEWMSELPAWIRSARQ